jgi:hypothetical protein
MDRKLCSCVALALLCVSLAGTCVKGQSASAPFAFHSGQSMYIVAFRRERQSVVIDPLRGSITPPDYVDLELDAEKKVRTRIEQWGFFRVAEKPKDADFVFLVSLDDTSIEGLVVPFEAYRQHLKDRFDLDALRDAAYARYLAGPLKLATLSRLSERLVKEFRAKIESRSSNSK